jgi:predicted dehydrogenase
MSVFYDKSDQTNKDRTDARDTNTMSDKPSFPTRRTFIENTGKLSAGAFTAATVAGGLFTGTPALARDPKKKLGVALVGLGNLSTNQIAPALKKTAHCRLAGIVSGTPEKRKQWATEHDLPESSIYDYESFDQIADNDEIDIVYVVLPNSMHAEYTIRAAKAGKHVFCEKPMANSSEDCRKMIDACRAANKKLGIGYRCQFEPHHLECMKFAQEKTFGELKHITAGFGFKMGNPKQWRLNKELAGGGPLMDVGIYALQACRYLTGGEPESISAMEIKTDPVKFAEVEETLNWTMQIGDVSCSCQTSYAYNGINRFRAYCSNGHFGLAPAYYYNGIEGTSSRGPIKFPQPDHFQLELDDFAQCIKYDTPTKVPGEEGLRDLLVVEAIYKSAATGKTVTPAAFE